MTEMTAAAGKREQDAEESEQLAACSDGKDHDDRMQTDAVTDQLRRQHRPFDELADAEGRNYAGEFEKRVDFEDDSQTGQQDPENETQVRHES